MTPREWFEGVLGYRLKVDEKYKVDYWERPDGMMVNSSFDGTFLGNGQENMIREFQSEWIEHVVKPMREMGYWYFIDDQYDCNRDKKYLIFGWIKVQGYPYDVEIQDDNICQASLDAAEQCPEVKAKLEKWRANAKLEG